VGSTTVTVRARAAGVAERTTSLVAAVVLPPDFSLAASTVSIAQGDSAAWAVTATRSGGFTAAIPLSVTGLPPGVATPGATIPAGENSATVVLRATLDAAPGSATAAVVANVDGVAARSATGVVTVTPSGFTIAANGGATLARGESAPVEVSVARTGIFAGAVELTLAGLPQGVAASAVTVGPATEAETVTFSAGSAVPLGTSVVTVTGRAAGFPDRLATVQLTVTGADTLALALAASAEEVEQGRQVTIPLTLTRSAGLAVPVALTVTGLPAGTVATLEPQTVPADENGSALILSVGAATPAGHHAITVSGTAGDQAFASAVLDLSVRESPVGVYALKTVNGHVLPFVVVDNATQKLEALAGTTTLTTSGTYVWEGSYRKTDKTTGAVETGVERDTGTFTVEGTTITLMDDRTGTKVVGTLQSNRLVLQNAHGEVVYVK
jgi:hypothetical protein